MYRRLLLLTHRWLGLTLALLLLPVALTGSVLVWKTELDRWVNPGAFRAPVHTGPLLSERELARKVEAGHPPAQVAWVELPSRAGDTARAQVRNWPDSRAPDLVFNELFLDPFTGTVLAARSTTTPRPTRLELLPWLRRLHYTLLLKRTGMLIVGTVAIFWLCDCFVAAALTLPRRLPAWRKWRLAWRLRGTRVLYDLHRASGLWLWPVLVVLVVLAVSGIYLNLTHEVFVPAVEFVLQVLPPGSREPVQEAILESQFPLHTGVAFGLAGRALVCLAGIATAALAVTGLTLALRKLLWTRGWR